MKTFVWLLSLVAVIGLQGSESGDPMEVCDNKYTACTENCDKMVDAPASCYDSCDSAYQKCLDIANGYTPAPEPKKENTEPKKEAPQKDEPKKEEPKPVS